MAPRFFGVIQHHDAWLFLQQSENIDIVPSYTTLLRTRSLLEEGCQIWEIALNIQRTENVIETALESDRGLKCLLKRFKSGDWSKLEDERLLNLIDNNLIIDTNIIALEMGRERSSVAQRLKAMRDSGEYPGPTFNQNPTPFSTEFFAGDFTEEEHAIVVHRMGHIIEELAKGTLSPRWKEFVSSKSTKEWIETFLPLIPTTIKRVLAAPRPPTIADWDRLEWQRTSSMGVYAWVLKRRLIHPLDNIPYVCINSATWQGQGLDQRKWLHEARKEHPFFDGVIKNRGLWRKPGPFITILRWDGENCFDTKYLITFAEAIFTVWFRALRIPGQDERLEKWIGRADEVERVAELKTEYSRLNSLSPWGYDQVTYRGMSTHNPLQRVMTFTEFASDNSDFGAWVTHTSSTKGRSQSRNRR
ncbi:hypothetical protein QBC43DRAFT_284873 [Cladorrhinum sp. PSN259]|nr:hypothetical protein QBC43DRAFT_284873 [Cladorrhinum sp. PSN259]